MRVETSTSGASLGSWRQSDPASTIVDLDKEEAFGVFVDQYISEADDDAEVPKQEVYSAYESWATGHSLEIPTNSWISQELNNHVNVGRRRIRIDGDPTRTFTGITLDTDDDSE